MQNRSDETYYEVFVRSEQSDDSRLRLVCTPNGYTVVTVNWGSAPVIAQGTELLDYALSQNPEHCREPDAYGKWVWDEWETNSGKASYSVTLYAEGSDDIYLDIYCRGDEPSDRSALVTWGEERPAVDENGYRIKQSGGGLHSTGHQVSVRYGKGVTQSENWQLFSPEQSSRNRSLPQAYIGSGRAGFISCPEWTR